MRIIGLSLGVVGVCLAIAWSLLAYAVVEGPAFPAIPPNLLALIGSFVFFRLAFIAIVVGALMVSLYYVGTMFTTSTKMYRALSPEKKKKVWEDFFSGLNVFKEILGVVRGFRKPAR